MPPWLLAAEDAMPALPWPYVVVLCGAFGATVVAFWKRDERREKRSEAREEARDALLLAVVPVLEKSKDVLERLARRSTQ